MAVRDGLDTICMRSANFLHPWSTRARIGLCAVGDETGDQEKQLRGKGEYQDGCCPCEKSAGIMSKTSGAGEADERRGCQSR